MLTVRVQGPCLKEAASSVGCHTTDLDCQCGPFKAAVINTADLECIREKCGTQTGEIARSAASVVCNCRTTPADVPASTTLTVQASPTLETAAPEPTEAATLDDAEDFSDDSLSTTADPESTSSKEHHFFNFSRQEESVRSFAHDVLDIFH